MAFNGYSPYGNYSTYGNYYTPQQPQQMPQMQAQQQITMPQANNSGLIWVEGAEAAKAYMVAPQNTVVLFDTKAPVMYIKSADISGMPSTRIFKIEEIGDKPVTAQAETASKDEITDLKERIAVLEKQICNFKSKEKELTENEPVV